jgi:hypothetical protein
MSTSQYQTRPEVTLDEAISPVAEEPAGQAEAATIDPFRYNAECGHPDQPETD